MLAARERGEDLALRTSGSTGRPRTVLRSTDSWWDSFDAYAELSGVAPGARLWVPGPLRSTMNLFAAVHAAWAGARLVEDPQRATHACLTPTMLDRRGDELRAGTRVVVGGAALGPALHRRATGHGLDVRHYYGAAELSFVASGAHAEDLRPFPGVEVRIRGGVIEVRSGYLARGLTGWATVGDLGRLERGRLVVLGRPGTVTTAGATVSLAEVEATLRPLATGPFAVLGVPHPSLGAVLAVVLTRPGDRTALARAARARLSPGHRPRLWRVVDALPLTEAGKVDRAALGALFDDPTFADTAATR